jgi:fucose permease
MALFDASRGNFIPFFIEEFKINNTVISLILSLNTLGNIIGSFLGGHFCEKYGHKTVYIIGSIIAAIGVLISPFTQNIFMLGLFYFIYGIGRQFLCIGIDSMVPILSVGFESILMNITHFMFGLGSFAGQSAYGKLLSQGIPWRTIYLYLGIFFVVSVILSIIVKTPKIQVTSVSFKRTDLYKNPLVYMFVLALTFGLISESVIITWFISYIRESYLLNPADAAKFASMFFLMFALGRLCGGFVLNKLGDYKGLKLFLLMAAIFTLAGLLLKQKGLILISMSGFFISLTFPTFMVIINSAFRQNSSFAIGLIVTISNILYVVLFNITGVLNDLFGTYAAFYAAPISIICCFMMLSIIGKKLNNEKI